MDEIKNTDDDGNTPDLFLNDIQPVGIIMQDPKVMVEIIYSDPEDSGVIRVRDLEGNLMVDVKADGRVIYGAGWEDKADEIATKFWQALAFSCPWMKAV